MADGWARVTGRVGVCSVHQGPGPDERRDRSRRGGEGAHAGPRHRRGHARRRAHLELPHRPARPRELGRRDRRDGLQRRDRRGRRRARVPSRRARTAARRAEPADRPAGAARRRRARAAACCPCRRRRRRARRRSPPSPTCCRARSGRSIIAGRGAVLGGAGPALAALGARAGALLANSAMAQGIFHGDPWALRISGGFASPVAAELLPQADVVLAFGAALNHWTTRHGELIGPQARVVQVDVEPRAIGANRRIDLAVVGDTRAVAEAVEAELAARGHSATGYRTDEVGAQLAARRWRDEPYEPSTARRLRRPARLLDRARRPAAVAQDRRDRLRALHGLARDVPRRRGRTALGLHERLPGGRARPGRRDRRGGRRTGCDHGRRARRRRAVLRAAGARQRGPRRR